MNNNSFGNWVKEQIRQSGLSMRGAAKKAGISQTLMSHVVTGKRPATRDFCFSIARALGRPVFEFLYHANLAGEDDRPATTFVEPGMDEVVKLALELTPEQRQDAVTLMRALRERRLSLYIARPEDDAQTSSVDDGKMIE